MDIRATHSGRRAAATAGCASTRPALDFQWGWLAVAAAIRARRPLALALDRSGAPHTARSERRPHAGERLDAAADARRAASGEREISRRPHGGRRARRRATHTRQRRASHTTPHPRSGVLALLFTTYTYVTLKAEPTGNDVGRPWSTSTAP